jgi:hypothetical protein
LQKAWQSGKPPKMMKEMKLLLTSRTKERQHVSKPKHRLKVAEAVVVEA